MQALGSADNDVEQCFQKRVAKPERMNTDMVSGSSHDEHRWHTVTNDSYSAPSFNFRKTLGRRRELVKTFIGQHVFEEAMRAMVADPPIESDKPSEYVDNFCDSKFIPFMDRTEYDVQKHLKYPLYGGAAVQSYYKCQVDKGTLKARSEIWNFNEPFRRSCSFTTPPELAIREPTGGF